MSKVKQNGPLPGRPDDAPIGKKFTLDSRKVKKLNLQILVRSRRGSDYACS